MQVFRIVLFSGQQSREDVYSGYNPGGVNTSGFYILIGKAQVKMSVICSECINFEIIGCSGK